jgi:hypothetical protein
MMGQSLAHISRLARVEPRVRLPGEPPRVRDLHEHFGIALERDRFLQLIGPIHRAVGHVVDHHRQFGRFLQQQSGFRSMGASTVIGHLEIEAALPGGGMSGPWNQSPEASAERFIVALSRPGSI